MTHFEKLSFCSGGNLLAVVLLAKETIEKSIMEAMKKSIICTFLCLDTPLSKMLCHIKTSLLIWFANQSSGFYMTQGSTDRYL